MIPAGTAQGKDAVQRQIARNLTRIREEAGLDKQALADMISGTFERLSREAIVASESPGRNMIATHRLAQIAVLLNVPIEDFYAGVTHPEKSSQGRRLAKAVDSIADEETRELICTMLDQLIHYAGSLKPLAALNTREMTEDEIREAIKRPEGYLEAQRAQLKEEK